MNDGGRWVDRAEELERAAAGLAGVPALALDTEADSFYHYFHKCCLIQIAGGEDVLLVDPLALKDLAPLGRVLGSPAILKVLHAAEQDVLYLRRDHAIHLRPLFDTMIAAQLLGKPAVGLASLLEAYFGVRLDKTSQRDDWSRRPLSERQRRYATEDVRHLLGLAERLRDELRAAGRLEWAAEEFELVAERAWEPRGFDPAAFWGIKGAKDLPPREAALLREFYVMREERASQADVPPFRIASDETLLLVARKQPRRPADLNGLKGMTPLVRRRLGAEILVAAERAATLPEEALPVPPRGVAGRRKNAAARHRLERLREWRRERAAALGIEPGVLFPLATLEALAVEGMEGLNRVEGIPGLRRWRRGLLEPDAARLLA
ncbi:MAG: ribonuclease D [Candidatus Polarisedimenticolia bacterium]